MYDVFAFGDLNKGFDKLFDDFNGIRELFKRKGVSKELLRRYNCKMQDLSFLEKTGSDIEKGLFIISVSALEILLLKKADAITNDNKNILQSLVFGYEKRNEYPDYFQGLGFQSNFYSRAYLIIKISPQSLDQFPQKGRNPVFFSGFVDKETMNKVNALSYQLI
ncbi:hypothetical protein FACS1894182_11040 [Bacteroidia bacterium]|nr:hypothetical protein FACS1894182_11040 [Bacteroidia bacterium]